MDFKIAAAQVPSVCGDLESNIATHAAAIVAAARHQVAVRVFPELSLTGYEPDWAAQLAIAPEDGRLAPLLSLARRHRVEVVAGAPLNNGTAKPALGAIVFSAGGTTRTCRKMHLGPGERPYFVPGDLPLAIHVAGHTVGLADRLDATPVPADEGPAPGVKPPRAPGQGHSSRLAIRAPSASDSSLAHITWAGTRWMVSSCAKPQSVPAMTFSRPTRRA
jgi:hypothetical protein